MSEFFSILEWLSISLNKRAKLEQLLRSPYVTYSPTVSLTSSSALLYHIRIITVSYTLKPFAAPGSLHLLFLLLEPSFLITTWYIPLLPLGLCSEIT